MKDSIPDPKMSLFYCNQEIISSNELRPMSQPTTYICMSILSIVWRGVPHLLCLLSVLAKLLSPGNCDQWQWPSCASSIQQGLYVLYINVHHWNATHYPIWISSHLHPFKSSIGWGIHQKNDLSIFQPTDQVTYIVQKDHISLMSVSINTRA